MTKPSRVRQPLAVVADLTQLLVAHGLYFTVGGRPSGICGRLIAELLRSLAPPHTPWGGAMSTDSPATPVC